MLDKFNIQILKLNISIVNILKSQAKNIDVHLKNILKISEEELLSIYKGEREFMLHEIDAICEYFGISHDVLFKDLENEEYSPK